MNSGTMMMLSQHVVKRFRTGSHGCKACGSGKDAMAMSDKEWLDPELKAKYERNLAELRRKQQENPGKYRPNARPYKTIAVNSVDGIERMRLIWMRDNHPRMTTEMMKAGELKPHLEHIAERTRQVADQYTRMLMDRRRQSGEDDSETMARMDAMHMAIHEVVESW